MSDIKCINGKYFDFSVTNNPSFTLTAKELKNVGIKNYYFMLEIKNPRVADIDPFKKNITNQEITALMTEYKQNMWWFIRTAVRLNTQKGTVPYELHRGLAAVCWNFLRHQDHCICEPRQTYKTTETIAGPLLWAFQLSSDLKMHFYGKESQNTKDNLAHLKEYIGLLPEWLQFKKYVGEDGKIKKSQQSTEILKNNLLGNELKIHPSARTLAAAQNLGRGASGNIIYYDEIEFTLFFPEIFANSAPLYKTASESAIGSGRPACRLMSTTPGNLDTKEGRDVKPLMDSMIPWTEKIYDMSDEQIADYKAAFKEEYHNTEEKRTREVIDVFYIEYQYYQLRKSYDWVLEQYRLSGDKMAIRREILLQRLRGSTECPISPEDVEYFISNMKRPIKDIAVSNKWIFHIYQHGQGQVGGYPKDLDENIPYLVGIDPAGGGGGDNFAITIVNPLNLMIAAEFKNPYISGPNAVRMLCELVHAYIPKAVLILERNSMGITILQMLLETDIRDNLYWREKVADPDDEIDIAPGDNQMKEMAEQYQKYGTFVSGKVRNVMFELLFQHIDQCKHLLLAENLVNDMCKLVRTSTGRLEAAKGEHDDSLMSYLHVLYVYYHGDNLAIFGVFPMEHPVWGNIETEDGEQLIGDVMQQSADMLKRINSKEEDMTWDEYVMLDSSREEEVERELCRKFSFYNSPYKRNETSFDGTVNISPTFFDSFNGII